MTSAINWSDLPAAQQPEWPDADALNQAKAKLAAMPPLVFAGECDILTERLASVARGESFLLMGGDCAETFADATADRIRNRVKTLLQMAKEVQKGYPSPIVGALFNNDLIDLYKEISGPGKCA